MRRHRTSSRARTTSRREVDDESESVAVVANADRDAIDAVLLELERTRTVTAELLDLVEDRNERHRQVTRGRSGISSKTGVHIVVMNPTQHAKPLPNATPVRALEPPPQPTQAASPVAAEVVSAPVVAFLQRDGLHPAGSVAIRCATQTLAGSHATPVRVYWHHVAESTQPSYSAYTTPTASMRHVSDASRISHISPHTLQVWKQKRAPDGRIFWKNETTGEKAWTLPPQHQQPVSVAE